ncbi:solute carrier family 22 member 4-like isoform X2 [Mercenaria mercenaria]|uniref:solute carrier family 22 member 4-like isoform X2 n=1 Tax=Mercenaria mercenaria TaxID=6596 RepID=UPI00234F445B|nr:solute carrier family 22 member 4-like isoform X2 [Mercenaria mercenaria]
MSTAVDKTTPDEVIKDLGGCGRYQVRLCVIIHLVKTVISFSSANLVIITSVPEWRCNDNVYNNGTFLEPSWNQTCLTMNGTECDSFSFEEETNTLVSEFKLICRNDFIPSTVNSIQLAGAMASNIILGHIADRLGRKPIFLISILFVLSSCLVGFFSVSLEMFAVSAFFTGFGYGGFFTTHYNLMSEYTPARWRGFVIGFPSYPLHQCLLSLIAWRIREWRYLLLMTSILGMPCFLAAYLIVPESFRWYIAHEKFDKAKEIVKSIAKFNRNYDFNTAVDLRRLDNQTKLRYSLLNLFQTRTLVKVTLFSALNWITLGVVVFGLLFGIQNLSGNLYLNIFLFSLTTIPSKAIATWLSNRIGRKKATHICFTVVGIAGLTGGVLQTLDVKFKDQLTTVLAIIANSSTSAAWGTVQTMTVELYPTVIRNIGFGMLSFIGGIGSVIGPQFVYLVDAPVTTALNEVSELPEGIEEEIAGVNGHI